jgi:hypothetical protein
MSDQLEFKVSESLVRPIIEAKINAAVIEAMGGAQKIVEDMLKTYMGQKVDSEGKPSGYGNTAPRLEWLLHKMIEDALKEALRGFLQKKQDLLQREFEKFFASKQGSSQIISALRDGFVKSLSEKWTSVIQFNQRRD